MTETESLCFKSQEERVFLTHEFSGDRQASHRYFKIQSVLLYLPRGMEQAVGRTRSSSCWHKGKGLQAVDACFPSLSTVCSRKRAGAGGGGSFGRKKQKEGLFSNTYYTPSPGPNTLYNIAVYDNGH